MVIYLLFWAAGIILDELCTGNHSIINIHGNARAGLEQAMHEWKSENVLLHFLAKHLLFRGLKYP